MKQRELAEQLGSLKDQLLKSKSEIVGKIQALEDAVKAGQDGDLSPEVLEAFQALRAEVQDIDDLNPDAPVTPPPAAPPAS